ncbi:MAG TPA: hypothetical protein PLK04_02530 [Bacillota bacterium]|jgi:hypothetical protein|nr:hypothetical protein [Bacillota bacterium]
MNAWLRGFVHTRKCQLQIEAALFTVMIIDTKLGKTSPETPVGIAEAGFQFQSDVDYT